MAQELAAPLDVSPSASAPARNRLIDLGRFVRREPLGAVGVVLILVVVVSAIAAPLLTSRDPQAFSRDILKAPSATHFFGTTREGKDVYARVLYGARVSLRVGLATVIISVLGGTMLALLAGTLRGVIDVLFSRVAEILIAFPAILFALTLRASLGSNVPSLPFVSRGEAVVITAICILYTPAIFRIMRSTVLIQHAQAYVDAARVIGASDLRVMLRHMLPNIVGLMIILASTTLPAAILTESALSFLGVGVPVGTPSWGADLSGNARNFFVRAPWIAIFPGLALSITVIAFNLLGDSLRDQLDPRLRGRI